MSDDRGWSAGTTRRSALLATVCVFASLVFLQELAVRAGITADASWLPAVVGTGLVVVAAVAGHLTTGARRRFTPVPPGLMPHLEQLTSRTGITRVPEFAVNPRALATGAVTLGRTGRYRLVLDAGLVCRHERGPERFTAVVLHELAHVRNRDVEVAQLTVAMWRVTSLAVLLPYALVNVWAYLAGPERAGALRDIALTLAVSAVLYLVYAEVLRTRELYADRDAISWGADPREWDEPDEPGWWRLLLGRTAGWFAALVRTHPTPGQRRRALSDPDSAAAASMVSDSIFSLLLTAATIAVLFLLADRQLSAQGRPAEWPAVLEAALFYPTAVVCLAALLAAPSRRYGTMSLRYVPVSTEHRRSAALRITVIFGAVLALLYATDPLHLLAGDWPKSLPWPRPRPPANPTTWATPRSPVLVELDRAWQRRGGLRAQAQLDNDLIHLRDKVEASRLRQIDWASFAAGCAAVSRDVDALDALGGFPIPDGEQPWSVLKSRSRAAVEVLCHHRYTPREFAPLLAASEHIAKAEAASRAIQLVLLHYLTDR